MTVGERLKALRRGKKMSQGDVEKRTGLLRCYISRVENGYTVPGIETLQKFSRALGVPMYRLFYDGEEPPQVPTLLKRSVTQRNQWGSSRKEANLLEQLQRELSNMDEGGRQLLLYMAQKMVRVKHQG